MAEILQFSPAAKTASTPRRSSGGGAILFFPGVRYERNFDDAADCAAKPAPKTVTRRARKITR